MRDKAAAAAYAREWRRKNKAHYLAYTAARRAENPEATRESLRRHYWAHREEIREQQAQYAVDHRDAIRKAARLLGAWYMAACLDHYGTSCACCGSVRRLTIDHVDGNGKAHRAELGIKSGIQFHRWLVNQGFPSEYQTLCLPCNVSKFQGTHSRLKHGWLYGRGCGAGHSWLAVGEWLRVL